MMVLPPPPFFRAFLNAASFSLLVAAVLKLGRYDSSFVLDPGFDHVDNVHACCDETLPQHFEPANVAAGRWRDRLKMLAELVRQHPPDWDNAINLASLGGGNMWLRFRGLTSPLGVRLIPTYWPVFSRSEGALLASQWQQVIGPDNRTRLP